jgi:hypothetical protein
VISIGLNRPEIDGLINNPALAAAILEKVNHIREIDVLEDLRDIITNLRTGADKDRFYSYEGIN